MRADAILRLENVVKHQPPLHALHNLKSADTFTVGGSVDSDPLIHQMSGAKGMRSFQIRCEHKVIRGLPLTEIRRLKRDEVKVASPTLPLPRPGFLNGPT